MTSSPPRPNPRNPVSSATGTSDLRSDFIATLEHRRFTEFCETCRRYRYVGLCYGTPGVGKTLSALHFSRAELARTHDAARREPLYGRPLDTAFYTARVINSPARVATGIKSVCDRLVLLAQGPVRRQAEIALGTIRIRNENYRRPHPELASLPHPEEFMPRPTYFEGLMEWEAKARALGDPTTLILIDEADRLRTDSLEEVRSLFDGGGVGLVMIGMPGIEKRMARYPQLYSRMDSCMSSDLWTLRRRKLCSNRTGHPAESPCRLNLSPTR